MKVKCCETFWQVTDNVKVDSDCYYWKLSLMKMVL